ncbi:hypothetical protein D9623_10840 [Azospirillum brasilense]|uniref:Uncharacterized protein n=1 Tax=Azospirillum brasilense TaxID=192 RepID=A0A0P0F4R4_AZOBR|nr:MULTISPECIES: hypothetical protein [Azospirillum]ALJ35684.1 hypothetical protein AMK58_09775 [Azospirillum brasilense]MDW7554950.1 hypothetical protein [Azospirillum brasilense]MDW7594727.1 hypothetical protein [Azospirillum brasilense]MDW7629581.1 hypothetical protein [Azospirillum brasilense]MDX5954441.1 hypothetical protein [Azospirillum brasilense]
MIRIRRFAPLLSGLAALALLGGTAAAQDAGGFSVNPQLGAAVGMSMGMGMGMPPLLPRQPVFVNAARRGAPPGATVTNPNVSRQATHQQAIAKIRGDAGFLGGFNKGQALAASRQPPPEPIVPNFTFIDAPFIVNNFDSSLALSFGDSNVTEQYVIQGGDGSAGGGGAEPAAGPTGPATAPVPAQAQAPAPVPVKAPAPKPQPGVTTGNGGPPPEGFFDPVMSNFGPLPHLPAALASGGIQFNNVGTAFNAAMGQGNFASQQITSIQGKKGKH